MSRELTETVKVRVDRPTRERLELLAAKSERSVGAVIRLALRDYLAARDDNAQEDHRG